VGRGGENPDTFGVPMGSQRKKFGGMGNPKKKRERKSRGGSPGSALFNLRRSHNRREPSPSVGGKNKTYPKERTGKIKRFGGAAKLLPSTAQSAEGAPHLWGGRGGGAADRHRPCRAHLNGEGEERGGMGNITPGIESSYTEEGMTKSIGIL